MGQTGCRASDGFTPRRSTMAQERAGPALRLKSVGGATAAAFALQDLLDKGVIEGVAQELAALVDEMERPRLVLDFGSVRHLSSPALGALLKVRQSVEARAGRLALCGLND